MNFLFARASASLIGSLLVSLLSVSPGFAQQLPDWRPETICKEDSARGQCLLFEQRAQNNVVASWSILPDAVRDSCLTRFVAPLEPSWRILGDCIEIEGRRAQEARIAALKKREDDALAALRSQNAAAPPAPSNQPDNEAARKQLLAAEEAAERKRVADEEASFMASLAEQRRADAEDAAAKEAAKKAAAAAEARRRAEADKAENNRVAAEEASFMALLAEQQRADAAARQQALARQQLTAVAKAAEEKRLAAEKARRSAEAEKQRAEGEAAQRRAAEEKAAAAKNAAEIERQRVATEEASFMKLLADQRRADAAAKQKADAAKKAKAAAERQNAARSCKARLKQVQSTGVIQFALNSADLAESAGTALLDQLASAVAECEGELSIVVVGHTDAKGSVAGNRRLSLARAQTVAKYLQSKGVSAERISARGLGSSKPIASNSTVSGRARNRRIEFQVE